MQQTATAASSAPSLGANDEVASAAAGFKLSRATLGSLPKSVIGPGFDPATVTAGILHLGTSNFALAHLGAIVNDVLAIDPSWGIVATSIRTDGVVKGLREQDGAYVLVVRENGERTPHVLAPVVETLFGPDDPKAIASRMSDAEIKLVTITVSNSGYCLKQGGLNLADQDVAADVKDGSSSRTIYGYLAAGLRARWARDHGVPLTVMSLDNIEQNSESLRKALLEFLEARSENELAAWVKGNVDFPVTLVDRITPQVTDSFRQQMREEMGFDSRVLVGTEAFRQLVVRRGRFELPPWASVGVQSVEDCGPYWQRKFFLLNAGHQVAAIPGQRLGADYIHEVASRESVARLLARAHKEWLTILPGGEAELKQYCASIRRRFADEALADTVQRVAARATSKVSERLLSTVELAWSANQTVLKVPVFVTAVWLFNLGREDEFGEVIHLHDADAEKLQHVHRELVSWVRSEPEGVTDRMRADKVRLLLLAVSEALGDSRFARIAANSAVVKELTQSIVDIHRLGVEKAIDQLLAR